VHLDDSGLVTVQIGIRGWTAECLSPVGGESFDMLRVEPMAERMGDHVVSHHPTVPSVGKTAQALHPTHRVEEGLHSRMMATQSCLYKAIESRAGAFSGHDPERSDPTPPDRRYLLKYRLAYVANQRCVLPFDNEAGKGAMADLAVRLGDVQNAAVPFLVCGQRQGSSQYFKRVVPMTATNPVRFKVISVDRKYLARLENFSGN
jgi:hypothetical protein